MDLLFFSSFIVSNSLFILVIGKNKLDSARTSLQQQITLFKGRINVLNEPQKVKHAIFTTLKKCYNKLEDQLFDLSQRYIDPENSDTETLA
jgi:hypothetical protein